MATTATQSTHPITDHDQSNRAHETTTVPCSHCGLPCRNIPRTHLQSREPVFCCAGCRLVYTLLDRKGAEAAVSKTLLRIGLGIFLTMNVMAFSFPFYGSDLLHPEADTTSALAGGGELIDILFRWIIFILATGVIILLGIPIARDAVSNLRRKRIQSTLLITIGVAAAYGLSAVNVFRAAGPIYFDSACMVLTLVTLGYYIEGRMKLRAVNAATGKLADLPATAVVERDNETVEISCTELKPGDIVCMKTGESVPVDGEIVEGRAAVVESSMTGEAIPRPVGIGDTVYAGSVMAEGFLRVKTERTGSSRRIEQIIEMLTEARLSPPNIQRLTDRAAAVFVPTAAVLAIIAFTWQAWSGNPTEGVMRALAVVLIACPCALGLAAPLATWNAVRELARRDIVVRSGQALEYGASLRRLFIDKTGTLTDGSFHIKRLLRVDDPDRPLTLDDAQNNNKIATILSIVASLEQHAAHPIALVLRKTADPIPLDREPDISPGLGVIGLINGTRWSVGRPDLEGIINNELSRALASVNDLHPIIVRREGEPILIIGLPESIRSESAEVVRTLRDELHVQMTALTGDTSKPASALGETLGIPIETGLLPDDKRQRIIRERNDTHHPIAYAGDGVNDAPALAEADLGIAVASGTELAKVSGDVVFLRDDLRGIVHLIRTAKKTRRRIISSLIWMFSYNVVGFSLALNGTMTPVYAAVAMVTSSAFIIWNSARGWNHNENNIPTTNNEKPLWKPLPSGERAG